ncbi:dioxygenase [Rhodobacter sp. Har01]|uniref:DODA-type extradiol aromatic ring-opening family dioxygenase n=1 Tax=Rhodobacter sp. Har01 TaxID=2883999 RepID=UPI001D086439|nr:class III extradiol ring-cleavage dioxygenase [Rhodobacter sp. Har01]MCB6178998.1 dioxygenase [Rhodobacter sp. Har01]
MSPRMPTYFISHGGGPWPWMPDWRAMFANLEASFVQMVRDLPERPKAILMISGHWEDDSFAVMSGAQPPMVYDYSGFPPETFQIKYPAPGAPALARRAAELIAAAGLPVRLDDKQGFDHGTFVPAYVMYPDASMPVFQISLRHGYSPVEHFALGRALAPLRDEAVLIVGSGLSYHNLRLFGPGAKVPSEAFDAWLAETMAAAPAERTDRLTHWERAPYARTCHAQEDHFVPLFAALGAAEGEAARMVYHDKDLFGGVTASSYRIG